MLLQLRKYDVFTRYDCHGRILGAKPINATADTGDHNFPRIGSLIW